MSVTLAAPRRGGLLGRRDFRLLWIGETTSSVGTSVTSVAMPLVALGPLHAGVLAVSALSGAAWLPWLLIGLPAGAWVDRLPRRQVMLAADLLSLFAFGSVPVAYVLGVLSIGQLLVVALAAGVASVFFTTAYRAYLPSLVEADELLEGNAKLQGSEQAAHVVGPGLAGLIAQVAGAVGGVLVDAVSFAVSGACLLRIRSRETIVAGQQRRLRQEIAEGLRFVVHDPYLRVAIAFGGVANLALTGFQAITVVFLTREVGLSAGALGVTLAASSLGGVAGALVARRLAYRLGTARALLVCKMAVAPFGLLIPLTTTGAGLSLFVIGSIVLIGGIVAGNVIWAGWFQAYCPSRLFGRVTTSSQVVNYGTMPIGALLGGVLAAGVGIRPALWLLLGGLVASTSILLIGPLARSRELPAARGE